MAKGHGSRGTERKSASKVLKTSQVVPYGSVPRQSPCPSRLLF